MSVAPAGEGVRRRRDAIDTVAGLMAAAAMGAAVFAVVYRPVRIGPPAILIAIVAAGMGGRHRNLAGFAVAFAAVCWFAGMIVATLTSHELF